MAQTGVTHFSPVLHNITPERVAFVYNVNITGSLDVALTYQDLRLIPSENIIGLNIPAPSLGATGTDPETPLTYTQYINHIENPLRTALQTIEGDIGTDVTTSKIWVIILGYGIPSMFTDQNGEIIAVASRLHRLDKGTEQRHNNHTYDRRGKWKFFDTTDAQEVYITAVIDGPTRDAALALISRAKDIDNQTFLAGQLFVDPYGKKTTESQQSYQADLLDFIENEAPYLGMPINLTVDIEDPYKEPTFSSFFRDAFYWGWFNPTFSKQLFFNQSEKRAFLYNADNQSASNIHFYDSENSSAFDENGSDNWCNIAINSTRGYAACSGSVAAATTVDDEEGSYLRPRPFFESLHRGSTLGEAFLYASKHLYWKNILIGDPLMVMNFPLGLPSHQDPNNTTIPNDQAILEIKESFEEALAWCFRQSRITQSILDTNVASANLSEEVYLLEALAKWRDLRSEESQYRMMSAPVSAWLKYILQTKRMRLEEWLKEQDQKLTNYLNNLIQRIESSPVSSSYEYPTGQWEYKISYIHEILTLEDIHFDLQVSTESNFSSLTVDVSSSTDIEGWKYESEPNVFVQMPDTGFPSNFSGRRVQYTSPLDYYLTRTEIYYVRWRAINSDGVTLFPINAEWEVDDNVLIISR